MAERNFDNIGRLYVQIQFDEKELEDLKREANEIAKQLRVSADCLDEEKEAKTFGLVGNDEKRFFSDHASPGRQKKVQGVVMGVVKDPHFIPADADVKRIISRTHELEQQIHNSKRLIEENMKRQHSRPD